MAISRTVVIILIPAIICVSVILGFIIGYFVNLKPYPENRVKIEDDKCGDVVPPKQDFNTEAFLDECKKKAAVAQTCDLPLPRTYVAYHLNGKTINVDGVIDDAAWAEVPWTEYFVDIRGEDFHTPTKTTRAKLRWDDDNLYVAAYMEESQLWAKYTEDETHVWRDNAFELFLDMDGSMHNYKELQINEIETTWDLMLTKGYMDGGEAVSEWNSGYIAKVSKDGAVNDVNTKSSYWATEWSIPFSSLAMNNTRSRPTPYENEIMFMNLQRPDWKVKIVNGEYVKNEDLTEDYWIWNAIGAVNTHIPSRWGLMEFRKGSPSMNPTPISFKKWHVYKALFDTFEALHALKATVGSFSSDVKLLDLPPYITSGNCVTLPEITVSRPENATTDSFIAAIKSLTDASISKGRISDDRFVSFE